MPDTQLQRAVRRLEWPMAFLALLVIPVLVMEDRATTPELRQGAAIVNWIIWLAFVAEFGFRWVADRTLAYPRRAWFDLLLIAISPPFGAPTAMQGIRSLRLLRLLRALRAFGVAAMGLKLAQRHFGQKKFHYILLVACATVVLGAVAVFYEANLERYIRPQLGTLPIAGVTRDECKRLAEALKAKRLKPRTVAGIMRTLSTVLSEAVEDKHLPANPALRLGRFLPKVGKSQPDPFNADDASTIVEAARERFIRWTGRQPARIRVDFWSTFILCGLRTGLRLGELIALEWGDIDWRARTVLVQRNFTHGMLVDSPKNGHSRSVDLTPQAITALRLLRRQLHREFFQHGLPRPELIFPSTEGTHLDESNVRTVMRAVCDKADLRRRSPHDLRHTFASLLLQAGASIAYVSAQLGHSDPAITLKVYTHWLPKAGSVPEVAKLDALSEKVARSLQSDRARAEA